ncbi:cytochrome c peroxidase [Chryseolinea sp. T2]|uniref:cytochrome-c peroxidase n=1 Tax=Chryseolinea sp. T2 TaxID=3129255 RepID=UPI0030781BBD
MTRAGTTTWWINSRRLVAVGVLTIALSVSFPAGSSRTSDPYPLSYPAYFGNRFVIPPDNPITREGVKLGRALFYDPVLSSNGKVSCSSCHQQQKAFSDGFRFSIGVDNVVTPRNSMSLANLLWVKNLFWDGRSHSLEDQASIPMFDVHEMNQPADLSALKLRASKYYQQLFEDAFGDRKITGDRLIKALAQFERTLISADAPYDRYLTGVYTPTPTEQRGLDLFMGHKASSAAQVNCAHCHGSPKLMVELFHNNGLDQDPRDHGREVFTQDKGDRGRFRVPTLRNIAVTAPYMHDGRFETLRQVLDHYSDHVQPSETLSSFIADSAAADGRRGYLLTDGQKNDIVAFLNMLTDSTFLTNPDFGPPQTAVRAK